MLQSFPTPRATTNPYLVQLLAALPAEVTVQTFSWRNALLGSYDVFHVHWPEILARGSTPVRARARQVLLALFVLRLRRRATAVVRTMHNVAPHEPGSRVEGRLLARLDALTTVRVNINALPLPGRSRAPVVTILHGHYRDWFSATRAHAVHAGTLVHAGLIRPYKNVDGLLTAFAQVHDDQMGLRVVGACDDSALRTLIQRAAAADPRVTYDLRHLDDEALVAEVTRAELVVLPYRQLHNSGAALLALSLDRPVLLPDGAAARALATEVGPGWVVTYTGPLDGRALTEGLHAVRRGERASRPDLTARDWPAAGRRHADVYRRVLARARP